MGEVFQETLPPDLSNARAQNTSKPLDPSLDTKASQLESEVHQYNSSLKPILETIKRIEAGQVQNAVNSLQTLRTSVERLIVADIPNAIRPNEDECMKIRQKFEKYANDVQNHLQQINEKLSELASSIQLLQSKSSDISSFSRSTISEAETEIQRAKASLDTTLQRLTSAEAALTQSDQIIQNLRAQIQSLSRAFSDKVAQFSNETQNSIAAAGTQLNQAVKAESSARQQALGQIQRQVTDLLRNTNDATTKMMNFLAQTKAQYQQSLLALSKASKDAIISSNSQITDDYSYLSSRMDQFISDSNAQFGALETDITSTIQALKNQVVSSRESLEAAVGNVTQSRTAGETEIITKYDDLKAVLTESLKKQSEHLDIVSEQTVANIRTHCSSVCDLIKGELSQFTGQADRVAKLQARLAQLISTTEQVKAQFVEQINQLSMKYSAISSEVEKAKKEFQAIADGLDLRLTALEDQDEQPNYATKDELKSIVGRTESVFDGRIQEIEQQLNQVFASISELNLSGAEKPKAEEPATSLLQQLVESQVKAESAV